MTRDFTSWLCNFRKSIADYRYYVDFPKVITNVEKIKVELNILNSLIGSQNIEEDFISLIARYPETLKCIPLLIAVRTQELSVTDETGLHVYDFNHPNTNCETYISFMQKTGLFDLMQHRLISSLVDYAYGIETGLDSNGRKNRGGDLMENLVEQYLIKAGVTYYKEMGFDEIKRRWGIDLSHINHEKLAVKRFDFIVKTESTIYGIETNFYTSSGSKLNETARSYKTLAKDFKQINGFKFIWITDGYGWRSARKNLEETFHVLDDLYSIADMETGIFNKIFR